MLLVSQGGAGCARAISRARAPPPTPRDATRPRTGKPPLLNKADANPDAVHTHTHGLRPLPGVRLTCAMWETNMVQQQLV